MASHVRFTEDDEPTSTTLPTSPPTENVKKSWRSQTAPSSRVQKPRPHNRKPKSIQSQIRSIQRFLNNKASELHPSVKKKKEIELNELVRVRDEHDRRELERSIAKKYRMVKFFERRKLERILEKIVAKGDKEEDRKEKEQVLKDLRYVTEFPKDKKYISLFPSEGHTEKSKKRVEEIRQLIEGGKEKDVEEKNGMGQEVLDGGTVQDDFFVNDESE